jgi:nitroreductase
MTQLELESELLATVSAVIHGRQTILPKRLSAPGPSAEQLHQILDAASAAPDHGQVLPWRLVVVPPQARVLLATVFGSALLERDPTVTPDQIRQAQEKAHRAPLLMLVVVDANKGDADIDLNERIVSAGCAVQNMLLMATAMGYGSALTSGKALKSKDLRRLFRLTSAEHALCFLSVGTAVSRKLGRVRPQVNDYVTHLPSWSSPTPDQE